MKEHVCTAAAQRVFILFALSLAFGGLNTHAIPQFAAMSGTSCIACHVASSGGGLRTYRGWSEYSETSLVKPDDIGLGGLYEPFQKTNTFLDRRLTVGGDFRLQTARSHKSEDADRRVFPMQGAVSSAYRLSDLFMVEAMYNFGPEKFPGQEKVSGSLVLQPRYSTTQLRVGYFRPSIGINYDDHTMVIRKVGGAEDLTLIPINYAEAGAEVSYDLKPWLNLAGGVFGAKNMAENTVFASAGNVESLIEDDSAPSFLARFELRKNDLAETASVTGGASYLQNGDFMLLNVFSTLGLWERFSAIAEYVHSDKEDLRTTNNAALDLAYRYGDGSLQFFIRGERGVTNETFSGLDIESYTNQGAAGIQIFLLPFMELRPEYRIVDTEEYRSTRWAAQLHLFY